MFVLRARYSISEATLRALLDAVDGVIILFSQREVIELAPDAFFLADRRPGSMPRAYPLQMLTPPACRQSSNGSLYGVPSGADTAGLRGTVNADWMNPSHRRCCMALRPWFVSSSYGVCTALISAS